MVTSTTTIYPTQTQPVKPPFQPEQLRDTIGDNLFAQGYRIYVRDACTLWIRRPNGTRYLVSPYEKTCTCRAGQMGHACKHIKGLTDLVFLSAADLGYRGKYEEACALYDFWTDYCFWFNAKARGGK